MKIYFDDVLVNNESVMSLTQKGQLFDGVFKLGSTLCRTIELDIYKDVAETLNIPSVVYIRDDDEYETVLFTMLVDTINKDNGNYWRYNLIDKMVLLNTIYNWSGLQDKTCSNILNAICVNVLGMDASDTPTLDTFPGDYLLDFSNNIMARDLVSWIAEIEGGFARISNEGNLEIVKYKNVDEFTCSLNSCADISIGDARVISKLKYSDGNNTIETDNRYYQEGQKVVINNSNGNITSIDRYGFYLPPLYNAREVKPDLKGFDRITSVYRFIERESGDLYTGIHFGSGQQAEPGFWGGIIDVDNVNLTATCKETRTLIKLTDYAIYLNNYWTGNRDVVHKNRASGTNPSLPPELRLFKQNDCYGFIIWNFEFDYKNFKFENSIGDSYSNYFNSSDIKIETSIYPTAWGQRQDAVIKLYNCYERIGLDPQQDDDECSNLKNFLIDHDIKIWARYSSQDADPYFSSIPAFPLTQERIEFYGNGSTSPYIAGLEEYPDSKYVYVEGESLYNENNTLELNPDNLLLKDLSYNEINIIFSRIRYFEFYSFKTTRCEINPNVYTGSIVNFVGGSDSERSERPVIAQIDWQYNTQWIGGYDTWLDNKFQEETKIVSLTEQIKSNISLIQAELENKVNRSGDTMTGNLNINRASGDTGLFAERTDTGVKILCGVGAGGYNHGVYSYLQNRWLLYGNNNGDLYLGGLNFKDAQTGRKSLQINVNEVCTSTNTNPGSVIGGTWTLQRTIRETKIANVHSGRTAVASTNGTTVTFTLPSDFHQSLGCEVNAWPMSNWNNGAVVSLAQDNTLTASSTSTSSNVRLTTTSAQDYSLTIMLRYLSDNAIYVWKRS